MMGSRLSVALIAAALAGCGDVRDEGPCPPARTIVEAVEIYGEAWNERDASRRDCLLARSVSPQLVYVDPTIDTTSADALSAAIAQFQTSAPSASIVQLSGLDRRDGELRFAWDFRLTDPATQVELSAVKGVDYVEFSGARITHIRGYWDPLPPDSPTGKIWDYAASWQAYLDEGYRWELLTLALAEDAHFTSNEDSARGVDAIAGVMSRRAVDEVRMLGTQLYPKFARIELALTTDGIAQNVTDYLYLDAEGRITRIARFAGDLPPL